MCSAVRRLWYRKIRYLMIEGGAMTDQPMQGRVALVAGASRGIGAVTAQAFSAAGASVVLGSRDIGALESVARDIEADGGRATAVQADVTDVNSMQNLADRA